MNHIAHLSLSSEIRQFEHNLMKSALWFICLNPLISFTKVHFVTHLVEMEEIELLFLCVYFRTNLDVLYDSGLMEQNM